MVQPVWYGYTETSMPFVLGSQAAFLGHFSWATTPALTQSLIKLGMTVSTRPWYDANAQCSGLWKCPNYPEFKAHVNALDRYSPI